MGFPLTMAINQTVTALAASALSLWTAICLRYYFTKGDATPSTDGYASERVSPCISISHLSIRLSIYLSIYLSSLTQCPKGRAAPPRTPHSLQQLQPLLHRAPRHPHPRLRPRDSDAVARPPRRPLPAPRGEGVVADERRVLRGEALDGASGADRHRGEGLVAAPADGHLHAGSACECGCSCRRELVEGREHGQRSRGGCWGSVAQKSGKGAAASVDTSAKSCVESSL